MIDEIQVLLDKYLQWLKDKTVLRQVNDWVEITTPYLDRHNDYLQMYARLAARRVRVGEQKKERPSESNAQRLWSQTCR